MNKNEMCFIHYLSCFLNSKKPDLLPDEWKEIGKLSQLNSVTGIIAYEMQKFSKELQPKGKTRQIFVQTLGLTICEYDEKLKAQKMLEDFLQNNGIDYALVKGAEIMRYYPAPELRTSGDIDVIIRPSKFDEAAAIMRASSFEMDIINTNVIILTLNDTVIEIHRGADVLGDYFTNSFFDRCSNEGSKYSLNQYDQLLYVILHLAKHLKDRGAGIRMLMDVDVCIRAIDGFDEEKLITMCAHAGIEKCAKVLLSLANYWFNTPVRAEINFNNDLELLEMLSNSFLHGGVFGKQNNDLGSHYVAQATDGGKVTLLSKIKGLMRLLFPSVNAIRDAYLYAYRHPVLIPLAYINRFFDGVFKRGIHSLNTAKQIVTSDNSVLIEKQIQSELEIF